MGHQRGELDRGHCFATAFNSQDSTWYKYNDESVKKLNCADLVTQSSMISAYVFFFTTNPVFPGIQQQVLNRNVNEQFEHCGYALRHHIPLLNFHIPINEIQPDASMVSSITMSASTPDDAPSYTNTSVRNTDQRNNDNLFVDDESENFTWLELRSRVLNGNATAIKNILSL